MLLLLPLLFSFAYVRLCSHGVHTNECLSSSVVRGWAPPSAAATFCWWFQTDKPDFHKKIENLKANQRFLWSKQLNLGSRRFKINQTRSSCFYTMLFLTQCCCLILPIDVTICFLNKEFRIWGLPSGRDCVYCTFVLKTLQIKCWETKNHHQIRRRTQEKLLLSRSVVKLQQTWMEFTCFTTSCWAFYKKDPK